MPRHLPSYREHKPSGRAVVQWAPLFGKNPHYLKGKYGSTESKAEFAQIMKEIAASLSQEEKTKRLKPRSIKNVAQMLGAYYTSTSDTMDIKDRKNAKLAIDLAGVMFGHKSPCDFGPLDLEEVRDEMIAKGWARRHVNRQVTRVRKAFKWAASKQIVTPDVYAALQMLDGLKKGWTSAPERKKVKAVEWPTVEQVLPYVSTVVADMIRIQWLTGMRSDELTGLRVSELDRSERLWLYRPAEHKKSHRDEDRRVYFGPKAKAILKPYIAVAADYLFSPAMAIKERTERQRAARRSPLYGKAKCEPKLRATLARYGTSTYHHAIAYGFRRLGVAAGIEAKRTKGMKLKTWLAKKGIAYFHPHQLRHSRATITRDKYGVEGARALLQNTFDATLIYAEESDTLAKKIAAREG